MKRTFIDKLVGLISPQAEARRMKAKLSVEMYVRSYDAAQTFKTDDWTSVSKNGANKEIQAAQPVLRDKAHDAVRNNPYAISGVDVIVSETVGYGIVPNIKGKNPAQVEQVREAWKIWGETTLCDAEGQRNFYGLQAAVMEATPTAGEVLARKLLVKEKRIVRTTKGPKPITGAIKVQLLESDFIDSKKDDGVKTFQGVEIDPTGKPTGYWIFDAHPGEGKESTSKKIDALNVKHIYRQRRPGQRRGVSWFHGVIRTLEDLKNYQEATLIRQKIAACFTVFVDPGENEFSSPDEVKARRELDSAVEPGMVRYTNPGEKVTLATPPGVDGYDAYCRQNLRAIAAGLGITYEALSNDYSQSNYSSSRLGTMKMNKNVDMWRWNMLVPMFCEPGFEWFLEFCNLQLGINTEGVYAEWTPPARAFIDPITEIEAIKRAVRIGVKTQDEAIREQGHDPETFYLEVQATNQKMDDLGLAFDTDARKMSSVGFAQAGDSFDKLTGNAPTGENSDQNN